VAGSMSSTLCPGRLCGVVVLGHSDKFFYIMVVRTLLCDTHVRSIEWQR
jgi:hypothetical protein